MSKIYADLSKSGPVDIRKLCQRPGKTKDGKPLYFTEQSQKDQCDISKIIAKYHKTGVIEHVSKIEAKYGDISGLDYKTAMDLILDSKKEFNELPSEIRKRFNNNPGDFLEFFEHEENREEAISLGLIDPIWTPESDGLGEHVKSGENQNKPPEPKPEPKPEPTE